MDFPRAKPEGNPEEQPCQSEENPILSDSLTQINILFPTRFYKVLGSAGSKLFLKLFQLTSDDKLQGLTQISFHKFVVQNIFVINYFFVGPL